MKLVADQERQERRRVVSSEVRTQEPVAGADADSSPAAVAALGHSFHPCPALASQLVDPVPALFTPRWGDIS